MPLKYFDSLERGATFYLHMQPVLCSISRESRDFSAITGVGELLMISFKMLR
jgi:hypothetical protein